MKEVWTEFVRVRVYQGCLGALTNLSLLVCLLGCLCGGCTQVPQWSELPFCCAVKWRTERNTQRQKVQGVSVRDTSLSLGKNCFGSGITNRWAWLKSALLCKPGELCKAISSQTEESRPCHIRN